MLTDEQLERVLAEAREGYLAWEHEYNRTLRARWARFTNRLLRRER
jgi:hypothetical protein